MPLKKKIITQNNDSLSIFLKPNQALYFRWRNPIAYLYKGSENVGISIYLHSSSIVRQKTRMENKKPEFAIIAQDQSVISLITELHNYFRDLQSYYKIACGKLRDQLEATSDQAKIEELRQEFHEVSQKMDYFRILNNAISTVDVIVHTEMMVSELNPPKIGK